MGGREAHRCTPLQRLASPVAHLSVNVGRWPTRARASVRIRSRVPVRKCLRNTCVLFVLCV
eukprot:2856396-Alexandrium_andersonii.AAC.1